ncbi:unnamed protein product [Agarophyton chilense]
MGLTLRSQDFTDEDSILILDVLARFVQDADILPMDEARAYIALPYSFMGMAEDQHNSVRGSLRASKGGVTCWPEAAQYLLRSYATGTENQNATLALRDTKQKLGETETVYSTRLPKAFPRCGNVYSASERCKMFVDGLDPAIKALVARRREEKRRMSYLELVQYAQAEVDSLRARQPTGRRLSKVLHAEVSSPSLSLLNRGVVGTDHDNVQFTWNDDYSMATTDLPTTSVETSEGDLAFFGGTIVTAAQLAHVTNAMRTTRPGWGETQPHPRTDVNVRPPFNALSAPICLLCYRLGHIAPRCMLTLRDMPSVVTQYESVSPIDQARILNWSYLRSKASFGPWTTVIPCPEIEMSNADQQTKNILPNNGNPHGSLPDGGASSKLRLKTPEASPANSPVTILTRNMAKTDIDSEHVAVLRPPWIWFRNPRTPDRILVMAKRSYKIYADLGLSHQFMVRQLSVLDTGAEINLINSGIIPSTLRNNIFYGPGRDIADAINNPLHTIGKISLAVRLGTYFVQLDFVVCNSLAAPVIHCCDFCDRFVEAIRPRTRTGMMDDGSTIPIVRKPLNRATQKKDPLPVVQESFDKDPRSTRLKVAKSITMPPESQVWVTVTSQHHGLHIVQLLASLYTKHQLALANGLVLIEPDTPLKVLVANFRKTNQWLTKNQTLDSVLPHPTAIVPTKIPVTDVLAVLEPKEREEDDDVDTTRVEPEFQYSDTQPTRPKGLEQKALLPGTDDVDPMKELEILDLEHVPEAHREKLKEMWKGFTRMWDGSLGTIGIT